MANWTNPCGGTLWRTLPDGRIEVDGRGVPYYEEGSVQYGQMARTWDNFGSVFVRAATEHGVPVEWLLAIATMETGLWSDDPSEQAAKVSPAGAIGVMQIMPATAEGFDASPAEMYDPEANIDVGARLIAYLGRVSDGELPLIAAKYNSGQACDSVPCRFCNEWNLRAASDYPGKVLKWNNTALLGLPAPPTRMMGVSGALGVGIALAGLYAAWRLLR
jgi:soluble lytic murein transglycosylase-like protein